MKFLKKINLLALMPLLLVLGCNNDDGPAIVSPVVISTSPINDATDVGTNSTVEVTFSKEMDPATINTSTFTLFDGSTNVDGAVSYEDFTAVFTPAADLSPTNIFTATITNEAKDIAGNALKNDFTLSFTSGFTPDETSPSVTLTDPMEDATDVKFDQVISIAFSEEMDATTINTTTFTLKQGSTMVSGTVEYSGDNATLTPTNNLDVGQVYTATVSTNVKDLSGLALATAKEWSFTTDELPTVTQTSPINEASDVSANAKVSITFNEEMDASTFTNSSFTVKQGASTISGVRTYLDNTATFTPDTNFEFGLDYTVTVTVDVKNLNGSPLAADRVWAFTTDILPSVVVVDPLNNATGVARNKVISITFSEEMDLSTITTSSFVVMQGASQVTGTIGFAGNNTARFIPNTSLDATLVYTATVTADVKDLGGNSILAEVWSFTTGSITGLAVVNLGAAGNYVILAKTAINNVPTSAVTGGMGLSPAATSFITGFALTDATGYATSSQVTGQVYAADMAAPTGSDLTTAVENMLTAYTDAAGRPTPDFLDLNTGNIGGETLIAGLYKWNSTVTIPGDVTLSGSADDVWIFQISNDLTMSADKNIILAGGAQAKNIFWQIAGEAVIGANSHFEGIILSMTGITLQTGASLSGRALAQTAVILDANAITEVQ